MGPCQPCRNCSCPASKDCKGHSLDGDCVLTLPQQSKSLLLKLGLVGSHSTVPLQNLRSPCPLVKRGPFGPDRETRLTPPMVKLGLLGSHSTVPPQNLQSKGLLVSAGLLGRNRRHYKRRRFNLCEAQPPAIAWHGVSTASELAVSSGKAGSARPREKDRPSAADTAAAMSADEARPPGIEKQSATTESDIAVLLRAEQMAGKVSALQQS